MDSRELLVRRELEKVYQDLNIAYECCLYSKLKADERFMRIIQLIFEIKEKTNLLKMIIKENYIIL